MALLLRTGQIYWAGDMDSEGHREYTIRWRVESDNGLDGPANVMNCPGLPLPGSLWLVDNDVDIWAWCRLTKSVTPDQTYDEGERVYHWIVEQTFSTKPTKRCGEQQFEDPLLEPMKVLGGTAQRQIEGATDRYGSIIANSAFEPFTGTQNEWDDNISEVQIEQNVPDLQLGLVTLLMRRGGVVNSVPMWGVGARCVHLKNWSWSKEYYGFCYYYYKRKFMFQVREDTFDRDLDDYGTMALRGQWNMDPESVTYRQYILAPDIADDPNAHANPLNFVKYKDAHGENAKVLLNGFGRPYDPGTFISAVTGTGTGADTEPGVITVEYYDEADLVTLLGLPTVL